MKVIDVLQIQMVSRREDGEKVVEKIKGWGVRLPSGQVYIEWNLDSFGSNRLDNQHVSRYGSIADVEKATSFDVHIANSVPVTNGSNSGSDGD